MTYLRHSRTMACACGWPVTADPLDTSPGVQAHVRAPQHRAWSDRTSLVPRESSDGRPALPSGRPALTPDRVQALLDAYSRGVSTSPVDFSEKALDNGGVEPTEYRGPDVSLDHVRRAMPSPVGAP